jgi:FkbM family methyltransferase
MYYSQFEQDEFLEKNVFKGYKYGIFVDIGAHDGISFNNTLYFEKNNNWKGYNIEPIKEVFSNLINNRPNCTNINCAISDVDGIEEFVLNKGYSEMISGLKKSFDHRHNNRLTNEIKQHGGSTEVIKIKTNRFDTICNMYNIKYINYLSIDVEGAEFVVIKSIDFDRVFIDVIGFENNYEDNSVPIMNYLIDKNFRIKKIGSDIFMINNKSMFNNT